MPKQVFDKLLAKCMEEKQNLEDALEDAYNNVPTHVDYKSAIATLHETIEALKDDSVSASVKNKLLLSVVDKIVYHRDRPIIATDGTEQPEGYMRRTSWYVAPFTLDVHLKI